MINEIKKKSIDISELVAFQNEIKDNFLEQHGRK